MTPLFEIHRSYQVEANRIKNARASGKIMHTSGDIPASGDEVEAAVRDVLRRRLSTRFYVGHGHIVDKKLNVSPQLDVIISDNTTSPVLFEGDDGTQYFPFESVYAFGEIKTSYVAARKQISAFANVCKEVKMGLSRENTPDNYLGNNVYLGGGVNLSKKIASRNSLLTFMLFVERGDMSQENLLEQYFVDPDEHLPSIVAVLDGKLIHKAELSFKDNNTLAIEGSFLGTHGLHPDVKCYWVTREFEDTASGPGNALASLLFGIFDHLNGCLLMPPPMHEYLKSVVTGKEWKAQIVDLTACTELAGGPLPPEAKALIESRSPELLELLKSAKPLRDSTFQ